MLQNPTKLGTKASVLSQTRRGVFYVAAALGMFNIYGGKTTERTQFCWRFRQLITWENCHF